jgi:hypothetical protein
LVPKSTFAFRAMAGCALLIEYLMPMTDAAASRRQVVAVAIDIDIPARDLRRCRNAPDAVGALRLRARYAQ